MTAKEPTRHQLSSRLAYNAQTPAFLRRLQNQVAGRSLDEDEDEPQYLDDVDEFGRERRPATPERPEKDDGGFDDEDNPEERPTVVVLKEGKHLNEIEVENEKRKAKGLPPLPPDSPSRNTPPLTDNSTSRPDVGSSTILNAGGLSFSSTKTKGDKSSVIRKRKAASGNDKVLKNEQHPKKKKKKLKKDTTGLLSFDDVI